MDESNTEIDLTIPAFLLAANRPKPAAYVPPKAVAPLPAVDSRKKRRNKKEENNDLVFGIVKNGADTFQKIRAGVGDSLPENEIRNALNRLVKLDKIGKMKRRYYAR